MLTKIEELVNNSDYSCCMMHRRLEGKFHSCITSKKQIGAFRIATHSKAISLADSNENAIQVICIIH